MIKVRNITRERALEIAYEVCKDLPDGELKDGIVYYTAIGVERGFSENVPAYTDDETEAASNFATTRDGEVIISSGDKYHGFLAGVEWVLHNFRSVFGWVWRYEGKLLFNKSKPIDGSLIPDEYQHLFTKDENPVRIPDIMPEVGDEPEKVEIGIRRIQ